MKNQRGFVSAAVLIAILVGLAVLGGGAYYFMQQNSPSQVATETPSSPNNTITESPKTPAQVPLSNPSAASDSPTKIALNLPSDSMEKYYQDGALTKLPNADTATFEALVENYSSGGSILFRDKNNVYFYFTPASKAEVVSGVDSKTFVHVKDIYYKDKNSVYYLDWNKDTNALTKITSANPASFQSLNYWYTKDNQRVFFLGVNNTGALKLNSVENALTNSFLSARFVDLGVDVGRFGADSAHVFSWGKMVAGADVKTFAALDDTYFKDANNVYTYGSVQDDGTRITKSLDGISPQNFVALGEGYGKTGDSVYFFDKKVAGADASTFQAVSDCYGGGCAKDKNHSYSNGVVVQ